MNSYWNCENIWIYVMNFKFITSMVNYGKLAWLTRINFISSTSVKKKERVGFYTYTFNDSFLIQVTQSCGILGRKNVFFDTGLWFVSAESNRIYRFTSYADYRSRQTQPIGILPYFCSSFSTLSSRSQSHYWTPNTHHQNPLGWGM